MKLKISDFVSDFRWSTASISCIKVNMASGAVDLLKIFGRSRGAALRILLQQSAQTAELCRPHDRQCSGCWMSYDCHRANGPKRLMLDPFDFPSARGLRTLYSINQKICNKKYDRDSTKCCSDE